MRIARASAVLSFALFALATPVAADAQGLVLLVRHAERADGGAPPSGMIAPPDPDLSAAGRARADRLAGLLADAGITRILTTEFIRTRETARPLAARLGLTAEVVPAADADGLVSRIKSATSGDVVLVVGHSNTVPAIIAALGGPRTTIAETDYDSLFVFAPATGTLARLRF